MILKCPVHTIFLKDLHSVFSDATFVWTHRDPKSVICSVVGLYLVGSISDTPSTVDLKELGKLAFHFTKKMLERGLQHRKDLEKNGVQFIDFYYADFIFDPIDSISNLYKNLNLEFTNETSDNITKFYQNSLSQRKNNNKKKPIRFTLDEIGLVAAEVDEAFTNYYEEFPRCKH